jgi:hypothetical protein
MMIGPDGKPGFPGMPDLQQQQQMMFAQHQQHPQAFLDMQMGMFNGQQPGYAPYNNNNRGGRFGRNQNGYQNGFQNNQNYNQQGGYNRSPSGQYRGNAGNRGGGGNRNNFPQQAGGAAHGAQAFPASAPVPTEAAGSDGSPRSAASSSAVEGSVPDAAAPAPTPGASSESSASEFSAGAAAGKAAGQSGPPAPLAINTAGPMNGQPGPFMNFGAPGTPPFFPNYTFNGMPMQYQGFPGMMPPMSPMNFPGQMPPQGFFPMQMNMHGMPPHAGFMQQGAPPQRGAGDNNEATGNRPRNTTGQTNAPRNGGNGNGAGHQQQQGSRSSPRATGQAATEGGDESAPAGAATEKKPAASGTGAAKSANRDRRGGNAGEGAGKSSPKPAAAEGTEAANGNRHRTSSTNSEGTARRSGGGAGGADSRDRKTGEKGGDHSGAGEKKKSGREKGRDGAAGKKAEAAAPAPPKRAVEFNMEADFPILVSSKDCFLQTLLCCFDRDDLGCCRSTARRGLGLRPTARQRRLYSVSPASMQPVSSLLTVRIHAPHRLCQRREKGVPAGRWNLIWRLTFRSW